MQEGCIAACSDTFKHIKENTMAYLTADPKPIKVDTYITHKALCGLNNPSIRCLLIPAKELHEWDMDPDAYVHLSCLIIYL